MKTETLYKTTKVDKVENISPSDFTENYLNPRQPIVISGISKKWAAFNKWTPEYFKEKCGNKQVALYNNKQSDAYTPVNKPDEYMNFAEYIDLIISQPTDLRIFLFNVFKNIPDLCNDFNYPDELMDTFLKKYPMLFFGGAGSMVHLHYDMDLSHIFLTQFYGKKKVILFAPEQSRKLYRMPFMVQSFIDVEVPDYNKYPALKHVESFECIMEHGDTLFIPSGYWHYMYYVEGGYALALRALDKSFGTKIQGLYNLTVMRNIDNFMKRTVGASWFGIKEKLAYKRAAKAIKTEQIK